MSTSSARSDFSAATGRPDGHLQGAARRLERLPESGGRRKRHGRPSCITGRLRAFVEAAEYLGRDADANKYSALADKVKAACEEELWDGEWYLRGITAKGLKIGTRENEEGKIFLESNTWAVVSDAASPRPRAASCMDAVDRHLYSNYGIHLLWPAFSKPDDDIGFMGRVYKGIKENAAIFSHPNPWAVIAECKLGRGDRAMKFYDSLLAVQPERHDRNPRSRTLFLLPVRHGKRSHGLRPRPASLAHRKRWLELHGSDSLDSGRPLDL